MDYGVWRVGGKRSGFVGVALLALLGSCTEPRDTSDNQQIGVGGVDGGDSDGRDGPLIGDAPATDARPGSDAAREGGAAAHLVIDKTAHDFGQVLVNTASATAEFAVTNDGGAASGAVSAVFVQMVAGFSVKSDECASKPLAAGARCRVAVIFSPTAAGKVQASLRFTAPGFDVTATLTAEGITPGALQVAPLMQDFGAVVPPGASSSQTFTVTNTGQQKSGVIATSLTGTDAKSFEVTADGCMGQVLAAQQMCQITVRFTPTALGAKSVPLKLAADPGGSALAQLAGTGITPSTLMFIPGSFEFGAVQQNKPGYTKQFMVQNKGQATTATLSSAVSTADFTITDDTCKGKTLIANATCSVSVQFLPATSGSKIATVSVTEPGGGPATAQLTGTSQANPALKLTPTTKDFNSVTMGMNATVNFQVSNDGDLPSSLPTPTITGTDLAMFSVPTATNGCTTPIPAKGSCTLVVRFAPTSTGAKTAMLTVAATLGGSSSATLAGTGTTPGNLALNLPTFDFKGIEQNTVSPVATFTVTNTGQSISGPVSASVVGSTVFTIISNLCNQMTLGPNNSCSLTVRFEPVAPGPASGTLQITANPGGTATTSLNGTGLAPAQLIISPTTFSFPSTVVGATSVNQTFTVTNAGGVAAGTGTGLLGALARTDAADFKVVTSNCTGMLAAGNSCMMVVAFAPKSAGDKSASVSVTGTPGGSAMAAISGTAQNPAKLTVTVASGSSAAFGNVLLTATSDKTFVVTNTGGQSSSAVGITLAATGSGFALLPATTGECMTGTTTLAGGVSCTVRVRFAPTVAGSQTATLGASATTGGNASLALTGTGQRNALLIGTNSNNFGTVVVNNTTGTINWTVSNGGDINTGLPVLTASNNEVLVTSNGCTGVIGPSGSCVIGVAFRPSTSGSRMGVLTLTASPGGSVTFTATANGQTVAGLGLAPAAGSGTNFGDVLVGGNVVETFVLTNTGQQATTAVTVTLNTTAGSGFALVTPPATGECVSGTTMLAGGASCTIRVRFTAPAGAQTASLAATATAGGTATSLALVGNGQRQAALMGTITNNFGTVVVNTTSTPAVTWTINNMNGDVATGVPTLMNSNPSEVIVGNNTCSVAVAARGQCTISVSFRPSVDGARSGTLTLTATPGGSVTFTASATGQKPALLSLAPDATSSTDFGKVLVNSSVTETFVVTNTGQQASTAVSFTLTTAALSGFTLVPPAAGECVTGTTVLAGGGHCNIRVTFLAPGPGVQTASLSASAATGGTPTALSLNGTGQRAAKLTGTVVRAPGGQGDFGSIVVGSPSGSVTWTITNGGDMSTSVPTLANDNPAEVIVGTNNCTAALGAGGTCTITVSFSPSDIGARLGTLTLTASGTSVTFGASATGLSKASLSLGPQLVPLSSANFGDVLLGDDKDEVFVVTNGGQGATSALALTFSGTDFMLMPQTGDCANGLMLTPVGTPGATCLIHVRFHPTDHVMRTASLMVSAMTGGSRALALTGRGLTPAMLTLTAQSGQPTTDLGYVLVGDSATATFVLKNNGDQTASGISVSLVGTPAGVFSRSTTMTGVDCGASLGGGTTCQVRVIFTPVAGGTATATVSVSGAAASFMVTGIGQPQALFTPSSNTASSGPNGMVLAGGKVWFTETTADKIGRYDPATGMISELDLTAGSAPVGIAAAADGLSLWFTESGTATIGRILLNSDGTTTLSEFPMMVGAGPTGIALGADGASWFIEAMGLGRMTTDGNYSPISMLPASTTPQSIALGPNGNLWFTESAANNIGMLAPSSVPPVVDPSAIPTANATPFGITSGADGRVWFTEQNGNKIGAVTTTGAMAGTITEYPIPTAGSQPTGITQGADQFIWFVEQNSGKLARITPDGAIMEFAGAGTAPESIVSGGAGTFYVGDPGTHRVLKVTF